LLESAIRTAKEILTLMIAMQVIYFESVAVAALETKVFMPAKLAKADIAVKGEIEPRFEATNADVSACGSNGKDYHTCCPAFLDSTILIGKGKS
jgi:hypothetical protein